MTLTEIKAAVNAGKTVHWANAGYRVICVKDDNWVILCDFNKHCIGLTWRDNVTVNGRPEEFFLA